MNEVRYKMALQAILALDSGGGFWANARAIAKVALEGVKHE
jgi:hypothetical protein